MELWLDPVIAGGQYGCLIQNLKELFWEYLDNGIPQKVKLKYADRLEFDENFKVDIQIKGVHGRTVEYDIANLTNHDIKLSGDVLLLKNIAGSWYIMPNYVIYRDLSGVNAYLNKNSIRQREVCLGFGAGNQRISQDNLILWRCHTIPKGRYALFLK